MLRKLSRQFSYLKREFEQPSGKMLTVFSENWANQQPTFRKRIGTKKNEATKNPTKGGNRNEMSTQKVLKCKSESDRHSIRDNTLGLRSMKCGKQFEWCQRMHNDYREFLFLSIFNMRLSKRALLLRIALRHLQFMG